MLAGEDNGKKVYVFKDKIQQFSIQSSILATLG